MKKSVLVLLIVLALLAIGIGMTSAQESVTLKALTLEAVTLYPGPSAEGEAVAELPAFTEVVVLGTNNAGDWLQVEAADGAGYAPVGSFLVLNLPPLAPKVIVATAEAGATSLFAEPDLGAEFLGEAVDGTAASVLGTYGEWAYIELEKGGYAWSIASAWAALPEGTVKAMVNLGSTPELGVFVEAKIGSEVATTVPNGEVLYVLSAVDEQWSEVMAPDGTTGYAITSNLAVLPGTMVETDVDAALAGIYSEPAVTADIITTLEDGVAVTYVAEVDEYWIEVYHPAFGMGYGLKDAFGNVFFVAENQTDEAVVRAGPSSFTNAGVAQIAKGTEVVVMGKNADGTWVQVALPFSEVDFSENGVNGWMAEFLFQDNVGEVVFDSSILSVTE